MILLLLLFLDKLESQWKMDATALDEKISKPEIQVRRR